MSKNKVHFLFLRVALLLMALWFVSLDRNPFVILIAKLGLSPSPLERIFGVKGLFCGMTDGMFRLSHGDLAGAVAVNYLTPVFAGVVVTCVFGNYRPQIQTRTHEIIFFLSVILLSILVNFTTPTNHSKFSNHDNQTVGIQNAHGNASENRE